MAGTCTVAANVGWSDAERPRDAFRAIFRDGDPATATMGVAFVSPRYDLSEVAKELRDIFSCPVLACTTAGEVSSTAGYTHHGIAAAAMHGVHAQARFIPKANAFTTHDARQLGAEMGFGVRVTGRQQAAIMVIDSMLKTEERFVSHLFEGIGHAPIVGGSAGDDGRFSTTPIFDGHDFVTGGAMVVSVDSTAKLRTFAHENFKALQRSYVITDATPAQRIVHRIDGRVASHIYAESLGLTPEELTPGVVSTHPLMLRVGNRHFVRGIASIDKDGAMHLFCAMEEGLVLRFGESLDMVGSLKALYDEPFIRDASFILGFDCICRALAVKDGRIAEAMRTELAKRPLVGFSTYGEQYEGFHVNQTLTGIAFGES
ncbi:MAG: FIST C-terminal domain-containing protein [Phycisphaerae bacterium]|jgi:hypothetical protein|nr:FIST C-terminal domain-containing protein [Phycisphaerae bacterium]